MCGEEALAGCSRAERYRGILIPQNAVLEEQFLQKVNWGFLLPPWPSQALLGQED